MHDLLITQVVLELARHQFTRLIGSQLGQLEARTSFGHLTKGSQGVQHMRPIYEHENTDVSSVVIYKDGEVPGAFPSDDFIWSGDVQIDQLQRPLRLVQLTMEGPLLHFRLSTRLALDRLDDRFSWKNFLKSSQLVIARMTQLL